MNKDSLPLVQAKVVFLRHEEMGTLKTIQEQKKLGWAPEDGTQWLLLDLRWFWILPLAAESFCSVTSMYQLLHIVSASSLSL